MNLRRATARLFWLWLLMLWAAGCSRAPAVVPAQPVETKQFQGKQAGVSVGVDPYLTTERLVQIFRGGDKFSESGVLPVQVTIENGSGGEITVNPRDIRLFRPNSRGDAPLSAQDAFSLVKIRIRYWALLPIIGDSVTAVRNEPILKDLESRELREARISPGDRTTGFVYFHLPEEQKNLAGSVMGIVLRGPSGRDLTYEIPIEGRRDIPVPSGASQAAGSEPRPTSPPERGRQREGRSGATTSSGPIRIEGTGGGVIIRSPSQ